MYKEIIIMAYI